MMNNKNIIVKVRGVILHNEKLLVVKHINSTNIALPGGHLEFGEDVINCLKRELKEELGVDPEIGRLLYINTYINIYHYLEFFFEVKNGGKYLNTDSLERTHAHELKDVSWVSRSDDINILPLQIGEDFKKNKMPEEGTKFVDEL